MSDVDLGNIFYSIVAKDLTKTGTEAAKGNFAAAGLAIGAALTGVAAAGMGFLSVNNKLMGSLETISLETGITTDSLRGLTMELSNGKDRMEEVNATMETLGKFGIVDAESMKIATEAALALGNANKATGNDVANNVVPALMAYGLTVDDLGAKSDTLTAITHSTKYSLNDVTNILARAGPTATEFGISFDEMTSMVEAMGLKGIPVRKAVSEIDTAIKEAAKTSKDGKVSMDDLALSLGLTSDQYSAAKEKLDAAAGSTEQYNDIAVKHAGFMANVASWWEKTSANVGAAIAPYSGVFQALTVIGPVLTAVNGMLILNNTLHITSAASTVAHTVATSAMSAAQGVATTAQWLLNAAMSANPIGLVILAVAGLVAGILLLDSQFHFIEPTIQAITSVFQGLWSIIMGVVDAAGQVVDAIASVPGVSAAIGAVGSLAGARASGGPTQSGKSYLVGESGPEIFTPSTSGNVTANNAIGGFGDIYLTGDITVRDESDIPKVATALGKEFSVQINRRNRNRGASS